jgi:ferrous iron transport protein B
MWERGWLYIRKAGTVILAISILMWALTTFPRRPERLDAGLTPEQARSEQMAYSMAGRIGHALEPFCKTMVFDWRIGTH